jgi:hypothetical protein
MFILFLNQIHLFYNQKLRKQNFSEINYRLRGIIQAPFQKREPPAPLQEQTAGSFRFMIASAPAISFVDL